MRKFKKLLNDLGYPDEVIRWMVGKAKDNKNIIIQVDRIGFEETSEDMMQTNTTSRYWCCVYDQHGEILVDASFDKDISDPDAEMIADVYKHFH